ncbi:MAG: copper amine oxidase N-terminal domain-containing protein [Clostridiales bacterium]|jgi:hypothetical protein|nr:copper amine oxidase N-terminal domain-containing protein [Clostridiales bacterium]
MKKLIFLAISLAFISNSAVYGSMVEDKNSLGGTGGSAIENNVDEDTIEDNSGTNTIENNGVNTTIEDNSDTTIENGGATIEDNVSGATTEGMYENIYNRRFRSVSPEDNADAASTSDTSTDLGQTEVSEQIYEYDPVSGLTGAEARQLGITETTDGLQYGTYNYWTTHNNGEDSGDSEEITSGASSPGSIAMSGESKKTGAGTRSETRAKNNTKYRTFRGKAKTSSNSGSYNKKYLSLTNLVGQTVKFLMDNDTMSTGTEKLGYGEDMVVVYDSSTNDSNNYRFKAKAITKDVKGSNIALSKFDDELISGDRGLSLNLNNSPSVISSNGNAFSGDINGKELLVFYDSESNSKIADARKIVVYNKLGTATGGARSKSKTRSASGSYQVGSDSYETENGVTMVPLEDAIKPMNLNMYYDRQTNTVGINNLFHFLVGHPSVTVGGETYMLDANPVERYGKIYVPIDFLTKAFDGQIAQIYQ